MPKTKISEYSTTNSSNTDIEGINIDEGCPPSSINNAIRELMVHLKEFQTGASGDAFTFAGGTLMTGTNTISGAAVISGNINSSGTTNTFSGGNILSGTNTFSGTNIFSSDVTLNAQKDLRFADSDSSNWVAFQAPATVASNVTWTLPSADGTSNQALVTNGSGTLSWATASASPGGSTTQVQYNNAGSFAGSANLTFDGTNLSSGGTITGTKLIPTGSSATGNGIYLPATNSVGLSTNGSEKFRINSSGSAFFSGNYTVDYPGSGNTTTGIYLESAGQLSVSRDNTVAARFNRNTSDGTVISIAQDGVEEGTISVSGTTVSYNGGHLSRWAQLKTSKDNTPLLKGTVMSNLDEMNVYVRPTLYWTEDDELPVDEEGNPTVAVGDVKQETSVSKNEQLNKVKVSDVEGDVNVAGVFVIWSYDEIHKVDEITMAMTGDMIIRIAQGVVVQKGDLLMSAGDGTAKPQGDDIVRSKTVAKVTSNHVTCTYADGSYCVPCVLMAC
jgi:hypothetical protein